MKRMALSIVILLITFSSLYSQSQRIITVNGKGVSYAQPDVALISVEILVINKDISTALKDSKQKIERIQNLYKLYKMDKEDHYTSMFNIYQERADYNKPDEYNYVVRHSINIRYEDIENVGKFIEDLVKNGVNQFSGIKFDVNDKSELRKEARRLAIENAKEKAMEIAEFAGVNIGDIVKISLNNSYEMPYDASFRGSMSSRLIDEPESISVSEEVVIEFQIY